MTKIRKCASSKFFTGKSVCEIDYDKIKSLILVKHGVKLDYSSLEDLREAFHADGNDRAYGFTNIINWEVNGGEAQTSQVGYGPTFYNGMSARTDTLTLDAFRHYTRASILENAETLFDMYLIDAKNNIYGLKDNSAEGTLAGIPVTIYPGGNDHPGASDKESLTVNVVYSDVEDYMMNLEVEPLSFRANSAVMGLMPVTLELIDEDTNTYKVVEYYGKGDATAKYGDIIATKAATVVNNATAVTYDAASNLLTITGTGTPSLKAASVLCTNGIYGIEPYIA